jgi:hypothetical protein
VLNLARGAAKGGEEASMRWIELGMAFMTGLSLGFVLTVLVLLFLEYIHLKRGDQEET